MKLPGLNRDRRPLISTVSQGVTPSASNAARIIRGNHPPSIMLFGVMPRAGTVHVGELISLHTNVCPHPNQLWEVPFLENLDQLGEFQQGFLRGYHQNTDRLGDTDFQAIFGAAFVAYLYSFANAGEVVLTKETSMRSLGEFPVIFPQEHLLLLMRDGRDLVSSSVKTWPKKKFSELCTRWADSARIMLDFVDAHPLPNYWFVRFEDILDKPDEFVRGCCERFGLDPEQYPFEQQANVEVIGSSTMSEEGNVDWSKHVAPPKDFRPTGHWADWSPAQKREFKKLAGPELQRAGYVDSQDW